MITHKQLTLAEVFEDCQNKFDNNKYQFLSLLDEAINLDDSYDPYKAAFWLHANPCCFQSSNSADVHQWTFLLCL